jgi:hypothetical protein
MEFDPLLSWARNWCEHVLLGKPGMWVAHTVPGAHIERSKRFLVTPRVKGHITCWGYSSQLELLPFPSQQPAWRACDRLPMLDRSKRVRYNGI